MVSSGDSPTSKTRALANAAIEIGGAGDSSTSSTCPPMRSSAADRTRPSTTRSPRHRPPTSSSWPRPIYRATFNGALKAFLDRFPTDALLRTAVVLGCHRRHHPPTSSPSTPGVGSAVASLGGWTAPTVVYATGADFVDGVPGTALLETLGVALAQARIAGLGASGA